MLIVAVSRGLAIPEYLHQFSLISISDFTIKILSKISLLSMCFVLLVCAFIILGSMWKARISSASKEYPTDEYAEAEAYPAFIYDLRRSSCKKYINEL